MTHEEKFEAYLEYVKEYCDNQFEDGIPKMIHIIINQMISYDEKNTDIQSESLGDYSVTFRNNGTDYPTSLLKKLDVYRKKKKAKLVIL